VLAIFLGGLSAGYALFGRAARSIVLRARGSNRHPPLLAVYGLVEGAIGVYALLFPWLFRGAQHLSLWLPTGSGLVAFGADVLLSAALIAPPTVLMGATIPMLTQALARDLGDATRLHALVYATNTAGAFVGALAAAFALVPWLGLDGVARAMGAINLFAGGAFALLGARSGKLAALDAAPAAHAAGVPEAPVYGLAALLAGFAAMTCQTVLIRIGGLALGPSEFTFAMVVASFVLAIAVGSLAVSARARIGRAALPATLWAVGLAFGFLYLHMDEAPYWGHALRTLFSSQPEAFHFYYGAAFLAALLAIGPPAALSGAVLPLIFDAVREEMGDLGAKAGRLYSHNTIGSLLGALIGGYALLFWLDLHHVFRVALAAFALAAALVTAHRYLGGRFAGSAALFAPALLAVLWLPPWQPGRLSSGLFRIRHPEPWTYRGPAAVPTWPVAFYDDDPTASVAVLRNTVGKGRGAHPAASLIVNGKPDGNTDADLETMAMAALLPALFAERAERAFVIGFGTGITAGYLADLETMREVTVAEISPAVLRAAPEFDFANHGASVHPKIALARSDAYRALLRSEGSFDVIVSEPSNPWVAGTEMLFSREFLSAARNRLAPGGVYVQWYHLYETSDRAVDLVLQTYASVFNRVAIWRGQFSDLLLIGRRDGADAIDLARVEQRMARRDFREALERVGVTQLPELLVHEVVPLVAWDAVRRAPLAPHTLIHPRLSYEAGRGFFTGGQARLPFLGHGEPARVAAQSSLLGSYLARFPGGPPDTVWRAMIDRSCGLLMPECPTWLAAWAQTAAPDAVRAESARLRAQGVPGSWITTVPLLRFLLGDPAMGSPARSPSELARDSDAFFARYAYALPFAPQRLTTLWRQCREKGDFGPSCARGLAAAEAFAATGEIPEAWRRASVAAP
jgi:spermidine synthase